MGRVSGSLGETRFRRDSDRLISLVPRGGCSADSSPDGYQRREAGPHFIRDQNPRLAAPSNVMWVYTHQTAPDKSPTRSSFKVGFFLSQNQKANALAVATTLLVFPKRPCNHSTTHALDVGGTPGEVKRAMSHSA